ncbi:MAG TPA: MATE family efflux transporter, partial [Clostridium sp.]|nr:MATE family efflux transporter [Clostridium sp.]
TAAATVIAQGISAILCILYIFKKAYILIPSKKHFAIDKDLYFELIGQGLSMGMMLCIVSTGTVILQTAINNLGHLVIAGHTAARKLSAFCMMPAGTIALSVSTFVSQNKGAGEGIRIRKAIRYANILAVLWGIIISIILMFTSQYIIKLLSGSNEVVVIENGSKYLIYNAPFYGVLGILLNLRNALQGLGKKVIPLISSVIEFFGKIIFVILFIPGLKYFGVIICEPVIWGFMCIQLCFSFYNNPYIRACKYKEENIPVKL